MNKLERRVVAILIGIGMSCANFAWNYWGLVTAYNSALNVWRRDNDVVLAVAWTGLLVCVFLFICWFTIFVVREIWKSGGDVR